MQNASIDAGDKMGYDKGSLKRKEWIVMIQYHVFPGGKRRVLTFSYDDGSPGDVRLVEMFNQAGVKGTFHLNGKNYLGASDGRKAEVRALYEGHEIACHTVSHGWPAHMPPQSVVKETFEDRKILEDIAGYPVVGMSYPSGSYNAEAAAAMRACGIVYSRTTLATNRTVMPEDFMTWHPTCHHKNAPPLVEKFMETLDSEWTPPLAYIWGHSHEFRNEEDWALMQDILDKVAGCEKIWFATNIEIYRYVMAQRMLAVSADEKTFSNPSAIDVWVERDKTELLKIPAGMTVTL